MGTLLTVLFPNRKGEFGPQNKFYYYYLDCEARDVPVKVNDDFYFLSREGTREYGGQKIRCCAKKNIDCLEKAQLEIGRNRNVVEKTGLEVITNAPQDHTIRWYCGSKEKQFSYNNTALYEDEVLATTTVTTPRNSIIANSKGENNMFKMFKNLNCGVYTLSDIRYSAKGIAFKTSEEDFVHYNEDGTFTNVGTFVFDMPVFICPVSTKQIKKGDVIQHCKRWVIVKEVSEDKIVAVNPLLKEVITIVPEVSFFGFDYCSKVMNIMEGFAATASKEQPFGNMLPLMLMSDKGNMSNKDMLMMLALGGGSMDFNNPMMMYMLMGDNCDNNKAFMMLMAMNGGNCFAPKKEDNNG